MNGYWSESHNHTFTGHFASESEYPYNAERGSCRTDYKTFYQGAKISGLYVTSKGDEETMKALVAEHGAVQTTVGANSKFKGYKGGVFAGCKKDSVNHAVVVVGYGTEAEWTSLIGQILPDTLLSLVGIMILLSSEIHTMTQ